MQLRVGIQKKSIRHNLNKIRIPGPAERFMSLNIILPRFRIRQCIRMPLILKKMMPKPYRNPVRRLTLKRSLYQLSFCLSHIIPPGFQRLRRHDPSEPPTLQNKHHNNPPLSENRKQREWKGRADSEKSRTPFPLSAVNTPAAPVINFRRTMPDRTEAAGSLTSYLSSSLNKSA
jgi:hypothetical protein